MSAQINLYDAALRSKFEPLSLINVVVVSLLLLVAVVGFGAMGAAQAKRLQGELDALAAQNKTLQDQTVALAAEIANRKPDANLIASLASLRAQLAMRGEVLSVLQKGLGPQAASFADYLRALARQSSGSLWLTSFSVAGDGGNMEIHGRMNDAAALPEYIRRLNAEKVFQGRAFAALQVRASGPATTTAPGNEQHGLNAASAAPAVPGTLEFFLAPKLVETKPEGMSAMAGASQNALVERAHEAAGVKP